MIVNKWDEQPPVRPPCRSAPMPPRDVIKLLHMMRAIETDYVAPAPRTLSSTQSAQSGKQLMPPVTSWLDPLVERTLVVANAKATAKHKASGGVADCGRGTSTALSGRANRC